MVNCFVFTASEKCDNRVRLFVFLSTEGPFLAKEILNQTRSDHVSPYPFRQAILYDATQPGNTMFCGVNVRLYACKSSKTTYKENPSTAIVHHRLLAWTYRSWCADQFGYIFIYFSALFLFDRVHEMYLWQGWWPGNSEESESATTTGSAEFRWHRDRKLAMQSVQSYADCKWKQIIMSQIIWRVFITKKLVKHEETRNFHSVYQRVENGNWKGAQSYNS